MMGVALDKNMAAVAATAAIVRRMATFFSRTIKISSRSRRDCGNREADALALLNAGDSGRRSRRDCGNREAGRI